jgi:prepilin-type N-terminal cleavage/methylation domain-containing protein
MKRTHGSDHGMTLVELMIVVVIIGVLAAISTVGYGKYVARARLSEANAVLAEFSAKEQLYFLEAGRFTEVHASTTLINSTSEDAAEFWPSDPSASFDSRRTPKSIYNGSGSLPDPWRRLGVRPRWQSLYCTYLVNAGEAGWAPPGTVGPTLWASTPNVAWFYSLAACNLMGAAGWPNTSSNTYVTVVALTHDSPALRTFDETE